jgi:PAT family beta-lactamase induction signal transducer AmpG
MEAGPWGLAYAVMALCMVPGIAATFFGREPTSNAAAKTEGPSRGLLSLAYRFVVQPFRTFIASRSQDGLAIAFGVLAFVFMFKLSDALAAVLRNPFLVEIGFSKIQIAGIAQTYGMVASIVGALLGGYLVKVLGLTRGLWLSLILMIASNLLFAYQAFLGPDAGFLVFTITIENLTGGFGTAAFVAYLSLLCDVRHTATQYALLTSLSSVGRTIVGSSMGFVAESLGWQGFFAFTAIVGVPAIFLLAALHRWGPASAGLDDRYDSLNS